MTYKDWHSQKKAIEKRLHDHNALIDPVYIEKQKLNNEVMRSYRLSCDFIFSIHGDSFQLYHTEDDFYDSSWSTLMKRLPAATLADIAIVKRVWECWIDGKIDDLPPSGDGDETNGWRSVGAR